MKLRREIGVAMTLLPALIALPALVAACFWMRAYF
jgi:hypothetical protein